MPDVLVSVVIPTFHREQLVVDAVQSALTQKGVGVEIIVLDDSAEGSAEAALAALSDPRVRYVRLTVPSGGVPALVRNNGLELARGRYVHFLDDDDLLEDGALSATVSALERQPRTGVAVGRAVPFGENPEVLRHEEAYFARATARLRAVRSRFALVATLLFDNTPLVNSECTVRRECAKAVGGYSSTVRLCEDVDFYLRAIRHSGFVYVDRPVVRYRVGIPSLMHSNQDETIVRDSYREIHRRYRLEHGIAEFVTLRVAMLITSLFGSLLLLLGMEGCVPW